MKSIDEIQILDDIDLEDIVGGTKKKKAAKKKVVKKKHVTPYPVEVLNTASDKTITVSSSALQHNDKFVL